MFRISQAHQFSDEQAKCQFGNGVETLHWRHNDHDGVSNHQPHGCLLIRLFRRRSKKASKLRVTGLGVGNSPGPANSPHKGPVTRKMFPFGDVIMDNVSKMQSGCLTSETKQLFGKATELPIIEQDHTWSLELPVGVSKHQPLVCLLNNLFIVRRNETSKHRVSDPV